jgi:hypothetical protein
VAETGEVAHWISDLSDSDANVRGMAAWRLRSEAFTQCFAGMNSWIQDPEFREFTRPFALDAVGDPRWKRAPLVLGIAVQPGTFERIRSANGSPHLANVPADQDALEFELVFENYGALDILTSREPEGTGAIARYLQKFGEGIQQIEVNVTDVDRATEILRTRFALTPIYPATRAGADGTRVNFLLVPGPDGNKFLIELVEPSSAEK